MRIWPNHEMGDKMRIERDRVKNIQGIIGKYLTSVTIGKNIKESQKMMKTASHWLGFTAYGLIHPFHHTYLSTYYGFGSC